MLIREKIQQDFEKSVKTDPKKRELLKVIIGEMQRTKEGIAKVDDVKAISILKTAIENATITNTPESLAEIPILEQYIPTQMDRNAITDAVNEIIREGGYTSIKNLGSVMKDFGQKYAGKADNKIVSEIVREKLNS